MLIFVSAIISACNTNSGVNASTHDQQKEVEMAPRMTFESSTTDFGEIRQGENIVVFFTYKNTGGKDLLVYEVIPSCGCTTAKLDKSPLSPGEKREVEVSFNSEGWSGHQQKSITFKTNGEPDYATIVLKGFVN